MNFKKDEEGQSLVALAVFMGLIAIGFFAIAGDAGLLFRQRRMAQSAADAAALAAATEVAANDLSGEQAAANAAAAFNGFDTTLATNPATVTLTTPTTGNFAGSTYVMATVSKPVNTFFLGAFNRNLTSVRVSAQAIAGGSNSSPTCVCLESGSGAALNLSNGSQISATGCGLVNNSSAYNAVEITGGAVLNALSLGTVSANWDNSSNINNGGSITSSTKVVQGITTTCNPAMPVAPSYSNCTANPGGSYSSNAQFGPTTSGGTICYTALTVGANGSICTLNPGIYVINGGELHFESGSNNVSNLGGNGVFFYLVNGASLVIDNGANVNLVAPGNQQANGSTAPGLSPYNGILFYQASGDTQNVSIQGGSKAYMNGSLYAPSANVTLGNGSGSTIEGGIVAQTLVMNGGATLQANSQTNEGSLTISSPRLVQ